MKFHILIFGCQMNYADSAKIRAVLTNCGFSYVENIKDADIVIFDTCSVKQKAEDKVTGKLKEIRKNQKVWITGCMVQHNFRSGKLKIKGGKFKQGNFIGSLQTKNPEVVGISNEEIEKHIKYKSSILKFIPQVAGEPSSFAKEDKIVSLSQMDKSERQRDFFGTMFVNHAFNPLFHNLKKKRKNIELFWRIDDTGFLPLVLQRLGYKVKYDKELINEYESIATEGIATSMNTHKTTAYVPISTGCNQFCAYCIVPYARGLEKYFPVKNIVEETKRHLKNGAQEIVLLGQIVNKHPQFVEILEKILKLKGLKWLRYTSPYPTYYSPELLLLHEENVKLCPHIHIPLQSGSNSVLQSMFRGYTLEQAKHFIDDIHSLKRDISLTTDIIVGFPGESEEDFQQSLDLVEYGKFDMVYIGIYSPRPGTLGAKKYVDDIPREVKRERWNVLNALLKKISKSNNQKEIGKSYEVLVNEIKSSTLNGTLSKNPPVLCATPPFKRMTKGEQKVLIGVTENGKQIICKISDGNYQVGEFVKVKVINAFPFKLGGEIQGY